jgi:hypothetical protein
MEQSERSEPTEPKSVPQAPDSPTSAFYQREDPVVLERLKREWEAAKEELRKYF